MAFSINNLLCSGCGDCRKVCAVNAIVVDDHFVSIDIKTCIECGKCVDVCSRCAINGKRAVR